MDPLRDRIFGLLSDLCSTQSEISPDGLRLLSHTLLGVARDQAPTALFAVRDALPWVAALVELIDGTEAAVVAEMLSARDVVRALDRRTLTKRLEDVLKPRPAGVECSALEARYSKALRELASLDARLVDVAMRSDSNIRDTLLAEPDLLSVAVSICAGGEQTDVARRFRAALLVEDVALEPDAVALLCDLESAWDGGAICAREGFGDRTRRFEISACDHIRQSGFAPAVRAALLYGAVTAHGGDIRRKLRGFSVFCEDRPLEDLAVALAEHRGGVVEFLSGLIPIRGLDGWVRYLRGGCHELADTREVSIREATSFAHYCFHLVNFCDLAIREDGGANDDARRAVMGVEDDLKEFALAGQRAGLSDAEFHLGRREQERWATVTAEGQLIERLGRLGGGWRQGFLPALNGALRLGPDVLDPWYDALASFEYPDEMLNVINTTLATMSIRGAEIFAVARPKHALRMLAMSALASTGPGTLDFEAALQWFKDPARRGAAETMLDLVDDPLQLRRVNASCGFVAESTPGGVSLTVRRHPEFEALLLLLRSRSTAPLMRELARDRISDLVAVVDESAVTPMEFAGASIVRYAAGAPA